MKALGNHLTTLIAGAGKAIFGLGGLQVSRLPRQRRESGGFNIGPYSLACHKGSILPEVYGSNQRWGTELGRLARAVAEIWPCAWCIDVGANVGDTAAVIRCHTEIPVLCIEGDPIVYRYLERNVKQLGGVETLAAYLDAMPGEISVEVHQRGWNATLAPAWGPGAETIATATLDDILDSGPTGRSYKLLKIDAEGFDWRVMRGAMRSLEEHRPVISFEYNPQLLLNVGGEPDPEGLLDWLRDLGYTSAVVYDSEGGYLAHANQQSWQTLRDLFNYLETDRHFIFYYNVCAFPSSEAAFAERFAEAEFSCSRPGRGGVR